MNEICKLTTNTSSRGWWRSESDQIFGRSGNQYTRSLSKALTETIKAVIPERNEVILYPLRDTFAVGRLANPAGNRNPLFERKKIRNDMGQLINIGKPPRTTATFNSSTTKKLLRNFEKLY
jgi:hypothetical protein